MASLAPFTLHVGTVALLALAGYLAHLLFPGFGLSLAGCGLMLLWSMMLTVMLWQRADDAPPHRARRYAYLIMFGAVVSVVGFTWAAMVPGKSALLAGMLLVQSAVLLVFSAIDHAQAQAYGDYASPGPFEMLFMRAGFLVQLLGGAMAWLAFWNTLPVADIVSIVLGMMAIVLLTPLAFSLPDKLDQALARRKRPVA